LLDDSSSFWFYWPMLGTGIGVAITSVVLLGIGRTSGSCPDGFERETAHRVAAGSHKPG
jgi:hypothetical protein